MDFFRIIEERRSMRHYTGTPPGEEKLHRIFAAANQAPSAGNLQSYEIYIVRKLGQRQELVKAAFDQEFLAEASVVLVFCAHPSLSEVKYGERGASLYSIQDATIACTFAVLAATALGLSTVWVGAFDEQAVSQALNLPPDLRPVILLPVGYAAAAPGERPRRALKDLIHEA